LRGKRMIAVVGNARLTRQLAIWAEELALEFIIRTDQPEKLDDAQPDYLVIDADHYEVQIPHFSPGTVLLLTRSKNISELSNLYPSATVLSLPLKKRRFLQSVGLLVDTNDLNRLSATVSPPDPMLSGLQVLVVDDNIVNRRVCVAQLQKLGVRRISEAENGRQAVAAAQSQAFDLILMDVQMPEIDGLQATHQIRLSSAHSRQPRIVGLTANVLNEERDRCLRAGMDDKLTKPVRMDELKQVLETTSKIRSPDRTSSRSGSDLAVCDERQLKELLEVNEPDKFGTNLLRLFIVQAEQLAKRLPELADNPEALAAEAHKLKSAAGYVGAQRLAHCCDIVEKAVNSHTPLDQSAVPDLKASLTVSIDDYRKRLRLQFEQQTGG
jgi:CheY-like chemotaxis protein